MKDLTLGAVKYASLLLIETNATTTTLDVKSLLRSFDYEASQDSVSTLMDQASRDLPLSVETNGFYRIFSLPTPSQVLTSRDDDDSDGNTSLANMTFPQSPSVTYIRRDGIAVCGSTEIIPHRTNWEVTSTDRPYEKLYFSTDNTRDEVRQAYASLKNEPYHTTRAIVINN